MNLPQVKTEKGAKEICKVIEGRIRKHYMGGISVIAYGKTTDGKTIRMKGYKTTLVDSINELLKLDYGWLSPEQQCEIEKICKED